MNLSYFISKRISRKKESFSSVIHKIAVASIAVGVAATVIAFLILKGFQNTVKRRVYSFSGHILVNKITMNNSVEETPMSYNIPLYNDPSRFPFVDHVQEFAHKPGLIKAGGELLGVVVKGVGKSFSLDRFKQDMVDGRFINFPDSGYSNDVLLSKSIAGKLSVKTGDDIVIAFFQDPPRLRKLHVCGLYETNLSDMFDDQVVIGDIRMIARLNNWTDSIAGGLEVFVKNPAQMDQDAEAISESMDYDLTAQSVSERYQNVFEWLDVLSRQVNILLTIILGVVCVNMISVVFILVMERTNMIGVLKALGAKDGLIRRVFIHSGVDLILKGLLWGNALGLGLCYLQYRFHFIKLNAHDYYMSYVPISWQWGLVLWVNVLTLVIITVVLTFPTAVITRISPIKAIRFD